MKGSSPNSRERPLRDIQYLKLEARKLPFGAHDLNRITRRPPRSCSNASRFRYIHDALKYADAFPDEIEAAIADNDRAFEELERRNYSPTHDARDAPPEEVARWLYRQGE